MFPRPYPTTLRVDADVTLRLAQDDDAETICAWTRSPEVHEFWGGRPLDIEEVLDQYTGRRAPEVVSYMVIEYGDPVGYLQAWQEADRSGLDMFLGVEAQGRGLGPKAARALAEDLATAGWDPLTADPAVANPRAVRAWRTAGFRETGELGVDEGRTTTIMRFAPAAGSHRG